VEPLLRRIAAEQLVLVSSGGSDWLKSAGRAEPVEGGFRIYARKAFASGAPAGDLLMTSAVWAEAPEGPTVLHFSVPLKTPEVRIEETWRAMGMRATGSHDVVVEGWFLADAAVAGKRPQGRWHPLFHMISMIAMPLIYSVYLGVAEAARDAALAAARKRALDPDVALGVGELDAELLAARLAWGRLIELATQGQPGPETTAAIFAARTMAAKACLRTAEKALELTGGAAFRREDPIERLFRDVQAARFHPLKEKEQLRLSGRLALGLEIDG
jgi:alkylation response protein AidB-like acyl-CoA dehydrogenase